MLHVTDALLSLGTLQVAGRSCWNEREKEIAGAGSLPRASTKRELSRWLAKGTRRWRTTRQPRRRKGVAKVNGSITWDISVRSHVPSTSSSSSSFSLLLEEPFLQTVVERPREKLFISSITLDTHGLDVERIERPFNNRLNLSLREKYSPRLLQMSSTPSVR